MRIDVLTLFPDMFSGVLNASILKRAQDKKLVEYHLHQLRDYSKDPHRKVDDKPFGGGPGMVLMCQPIMDAVAAIEALDASPATRIILCPQGQTLTQPLAEQLSKLPRLLLIAGHYEGFDERIKQLLGTPLTPDGNPGASASSVKSPLERCIEISLGDFILSGGELPAMVLIDAITRLLPGVLGDDLSNHGESFGQADETIQGGLEYPHYTKPREYAGLSVPEILLSGNHAAIERWRKEQSQQRTAEKRPDLQK